MKITRSLLLAAAFFLALPSLQAQVREADSMIHKIFASLRTRDQKAFVALYPNAQQFGRFMRNMMEQTMKSEEIKKMMEMDEKSKGMNLDSLIEAQVTAFSNPESFGKMEKAFGDMFQQVIKKGEDKGVRWSEAKLTSYTLDTAAMGGEDMPFQPKGVKEAKGVIDFSVGSDAYQLAYSKVMFIESEGGWFGAEFPQLARKGESLAPDAMPADEDDGDMPPPVEKVEKKKTTGGKAPAAKKSPSKKAPVRKKA